MRKNSVNRELKSIEGGVCAPKGFKANGIRLANEKGDEKGFALIVAEKRCSAACICADITPQSAPVAVTKRHFSKGYARAVVVNSGNALVYAESGEKKARSFCCFVEKYAGVSADEVAVASTGIIGNGPDIEDYEENIKTIAKGLARSHENSRKAAQAILTTDKKAKQLSYAFKIGDYTCTIGAIFKGGKRVCPNMATTLVFITTDVNISPEMLQRALLAESKDSFNLLNIDGVSSPNDTVCVLANGEAGNARIDCVDSEYKKFCFAFHETALRICRMLAADESEKRLICNVSGAKSKQVSRAVSKALVNAKAVRSAFLKGKVDAETFLFSVLSAENGLDESKISVSIETENGSFVLYEDGRRIPFVPETENFVLSVAEIRLNVRLGEGNYSSCAFGRIES